MKSPSGSAKITFILCLSACQIVRAVPTINTDVAIGKSASTNSAWIGNTVVFTIGLTNFGLNTASNMTGSDVVPGGFSIFAWNSSGSPSAPVYNPTNGAWTVTAIASGVTDFITISTTATNAGTYTNTALITSAGNTNNNTSSVVVTLVPQTADLMVTKAASLFGGPPTNQFHPGDLAVFTVTVTNLGPGTAYNIAGSDLLPAGFAFYGWANAGSGTNFPIFDSTNGTWTLASLAPGNWGSFSIYASAASNGTFTNTATITSAIDSDPNPNNNTASVVVTIANQADLQMGKTASTNSVKLGQQLTFTLYLTNAGPSNVTNAVTVTEVIPPGFQYVSDTSGGPFGIYSPGLGQWMLPTGWPVGLVSISITVVAVNTGTFTNTATVIVPPGVTDPNPGNNAAAAVVAVTQPQADLQVTKSVGTNSVNVGGLVPFTITITNLGPNSASNITVSDALPPGLNFSGAGVPGGTDFNPISGVWTIPSLAAGNGYALALSALATNAGTFTNTAALAGSTPQDTNSANNSASAVVTATAQLLTADLQITKTANPTNPVTGQQVVFTVALQNLGPNNVTNSIVVTDCLPPGFQYVTDSTYGGGGVGTYSPGTCSWTLAGLGTGATVYLNITVLASNTGAYTNTATAAVPQGYTDPNLTNNTASAVVIVANRVADLAVTKTAFTNSLPVFSTFPFSFFLTVTNLGPDTVSNLTLTDVLPAGLSFGGAITNPGSSYTASNGLWSLSVPLAAGQGAAMTLVTAAPQTPGTFTNTLKVNVPSTVTDPNTNNNSTSVVVKVLPVYRILGSVANCSSNGVPLANVTIRLSGAASQTTTTFGIGNGNYSFDTVSNGVYTVTPSQPGNVFTPVSAVVTVSNAWVTVPAFVGGIGLIYGQVSYFGSPVTNHPVTLSGGGLAKPRLILTDANGYYIFTNTPTGNYTVTAVATNGYIFTPTNPVIILNATNCAAVTNFTAKVPRVVQLVALEVVQVIQDWSNSVPLIQAKKTFVRAHLQLPTNGPPVLVQGARLYGKSNGDALPNSPQAPYAPGRSPDLLVQTTNAAALRGTLNNSLTFELPVSWSSGTVSLQFVCTNNITVIPTNTVPANSTVQVTFVPTPAFQIKFAAYNWTNAGVFQQVSAAAYADLPKRLVSIYPVPDVLTLEKAKRVPPTILNVPAAMPPGVTKLGRWVLFNSNAKLVQMQTMDQLLGGIFGGGANWIYYGAIASPSPDASGWAKYFVTSSNTISSGGTFVSSGFLDAAFYTTDRHTHAHEIGHNLGRPHDVFATGNGACGEGGPTNAVYPLFQTVRGVYTNKPALGPMNNGANAMIYGLDTLTLGTAAINPVVDPNIYFDVMSYCDVVPLDVWNSSYTYTAMRASITNLFRPPPPPPPPGPLRKWFLVRGYVNTVSNVAGLFPFWTVSTTVTNPPAGSDAGTYYALLFDRAGNVYGEIPFAPDSFILEDDVDETGQGLFEIPVPADPAIGSVQIWNSLNLTLLASITGNTNLPAVNSVSLTTTNGGPFQGAGPLVIHWSSSDADPNAQLIYTIQYSADGGATWETLDTDWPGNSYVIDSDYLHASTDALIAVSVSDGFNNSDPTPSSVFTVQNHPPTLYLNAPMNDTTFIADEQVFLDAFVNDPQDGPLDGGSVQWISSLDGSLGNGTELNFEAGALSEGPHLITVTAMDSAGLTNKASVQIYVLHAPPPQLSINLNGNNRADITWPSSVTNYVLEASTNLSLGAWGAVTNEPVAADAEQTVTVNLFPNTSFFRLRHQ